MRSLIGQGLLESWLVPFVVAGATILPARWSNRRAVVVGLTAVAFLAAVGSFYALAFGWPTGASLGSRQKVVVALAAGSLIGLVEVWNRSIARLLLAMASLVIPFWIGWPALVQDWSRGWLLMLPLLAGCWLSRELTVQPSIVKRACLMLIAMATGLALIAVYAKALSLAEFGLALASALLAIILVGPKPLSGMAAIMAATMLLALLTTLLFFSSASPIALLVLTLVLGAERLASLAHRFNKAFQATSLTFALLCVLPLVIAVVIARIDAGPFSIY